MKTCKKCGETKSLLEFGKYKTQPDGKHYYCKSCHNENRVEWNKINPDRNKEFNRLRYHIKYNSDEVYREKMRLQTRWSYFLKNGRSPIMEPLIGCEYEELMNFINKYSVYYKGKADLKTTDEEYMKTHYDIDHIIPLSAAKSIEELHKLFHISNLQVISAWDNRRVKRAK